MFTDSSYSIVEKNVADQCVTACHFVVELKLECKLNRFEKKFSESEHVGDVLYSSKLGLGFWEVVLDVIVFSFIFLLLYRLY